MAIPTNIKNLLSGNVVEWARIEFKESWNVKEVSAVRKILQEKAARGRLRF